MSLVSHDSGQVITLMTVEHSARHQGRFAPQQSSPISLTLIYLIGKQRKYAFSFILFLRVKLISRVQWNWPYWVRTSYPHFAHIGHRHQPTLPRWVCFLRKLGNASIRFPKRLPKQMIVGKVSKSL